MSKFKQEFTLELGYRIELSQGFLEVELNYTQLLTGYDPSVGYIDSSRVTNIEPEAHRHVKVIYKSADNHHTAVSITDSVLADSIMDGCALQYLRANSEVMKAIKNLRKMVSSGGGIYIDRNKNWQRQSLEDVLRTTKIPKIQG